MCSYKVTANDEVSGSKTLEKLVSHLRKLIAFSGLKLEPVQRADIYGFFEDTIGSAGSYHYSRWWSTCVNKCGVRLNDW